MWIRGVPDKERIISFIDGYETGTNNKCDFTQLLKEFISNKYKINGSNEGWPRQIDLLSKKLSLTWIETFKIIGMEIIKSPNKSDTNSKPKKKIGT